MNKDNSKFIILANMMQLYLVHNPKHIKPFPKVSTEPLVLKSPTRNLRFNVNSQVWTLVKLKKKKSEKIKKEKRMGQSKTKTKNIMSDISMSGIQR